MGLINDRFFGTQTGTNPGRSPIRRDNNAFGRPFARIVLPPDHSFVVPFSRGIHSRIFSGRDHGRGFKVVGKFSRVGIEEDFIGVKTMAKIVHICPKTSVTIASLPFLIKLPIGTPTAKSVVAAVGNTGDFCSPCIIIWVFCQPVIILSVFSRRAIVDFQKNLTGIFRIDGKGDTIAPIMRSEGIGGIGPEMAI